MFKIGSCHVIIFTSSLAKGDDPRCFSIFILGRFSSYNFKTTRPEIPGHPIKSHLTNSIVNSNGSPYNRIACRLCHGILPKKQVCDKLLEVLDHVPQPNDDKGKYICRFCWNKLNKLSKIEYENKARSFERRKNQRTKDAEKNTRHNHLWHSLKKQRSVV